MGRGITTATDPGASREHNWEVTTALKSKHHQIDFYTRKKVKNWKRFVMDEAFQGLFLFCTCKEQGSAGGWGPAPSREVRMTLGFLAEMPSGIFIVPETGQWNHSRWHLSTSRSLTAALAGNIRLEWLKVKVRACQITGTVSYLPAAIRIRISQCAKMKCEVNKVTNVRQKRSISLSSLTCAHRPLVLEN